VSFLVSDSTGKQKAIKMKQYRKYKNIRNAANQFEGRINVE